jgi:hypothetical protein
MKKAKRRNNFNEIIFSKDSADNVGELEKCKYVSDGVQKNI